MAVTILVIVNGGDNQSINSTYISARLKKCILAQTYKLRKANMQQHGLALRHASRLRHGMAA